MKSICRPRSWRGSILAFLTLASVCWLLPEKAAPQEQPHQNVKPAVPVETPRPVPPKQPPTEMSVFQVKHVRAADLARMIQEIWGAFPPRGIRVSADQRTNAVVVVATPDDLGMVKRLISAIDVERGDAAKNEPRSEVYSLHFTRADNYLEQELARAIGGHGSVGVDYGRNKVVLTGDEKTVHTVRRLLEELDRPAAQQPVTPDMQVRIVWLVSGATGKELSKPPEDLRDVVAELAKLGVENPRLVTQTIVAARLDKQFRVEGLAQLHGSYRLSVNGTIMGGGPAETNRLQISVNALEITAGGQKPIGRLDTEITAPLGHAIVLGMTPTDNSTSVFVMQILPKR
jgi:hypothetical protein